MQYLYKGSTEELSVEPADILELMAAANFFQLDGLLHYCEVRCASLIDLDNIVLFSNRVWIDLDNIVFISLRVWIEDAVQLLPRLGSSGRTLPTHEEGVKDFQNANN